MKEIGITGKLSGQGCRYHRLVTSFTEFIHRYEDLMLKISFTFRDLIRNGIQHPSFCGNVINKVRKFKNSFSPGKIFYKAYMSYLYRIIVSLCFNWF